MDAHARLLRGYGLACGVLALGVAACSGRGDTAPGASFYDQVIQPIFDARCVGNTSPCHRVGPDGTALGNLDLSSWEGLQKRRDVLFPFGSYPVGQLLLKGGEPVDIPFRGGTVRSEITHAGGMQTLPVDSAAYRTLVQWIQNGATRDNTPGSPPFGVGEGDCRQELRNDYDPASASRELLDAYDAIQPVLRNRCAFANCHGSRDADFYVTCGDDEQQRAYNALAARAYVGATLGESELISRPLGPGRGISHTGGAIFPEGAQDDEFRALQAFAETVIDAGLRAPEPEISPARRFFEDQVLPRLIARGCAFENCHGIGNFNDFKLRPGGAGAFSQKALDENYRIARDEFLNLESPDPRQSRIVKKPILLEDGGIVHRGGQVVIGEARDESCPPLGAYPEDALTSGSPPSPYCALREWHDLERQEAIARGELDDLGGATSTLKLVYVTRPPDDDHPLDVDRFRGGADLVAVDVPVAANGVVGPAAGGGASLLASCEGVTPGQVDVRRPSVSHDGRRVLFAMRTSESDNLNVYEVGIDGQGCRALTRETGEQNGIRLHSLDPVFLPGDEEIVFVSSRGGAAGPTRTLRRFWPNTDLFIMRADGSEVRQLTYTLNSERHPALMQNGQIIFTTEKATRDFYQLAARRINVDGSDFHPLFGQRRLNSTGTISIGFQEVTEPVELPDRNFVGIFADPDGTGERQGQGGTLGIFNRSLGPFQKDHEGEPSFLSSLEIVPGQGNGLYRNPSGLPDGRILAAYSPDADGRGYAIVAVDPRSGARQRLAGAPEGQVAVEPVLAIARVRPEPFRQRPLLIFGGDVDPDRGEIAIAHFPDLPLLATLMDANDRDGRRIDRRIARLRVLEERPPPADVREPGQAGGKLKGPMQVYEDLYEVGTADLQADGSARLILPSGTPLRWQLLDSDGNVLFTLREEFMFGHGERVNLGVQRRLFDGVCGGCHNSRSGSELNNAVIPDALTSASLSAARDPVDLAGRPSDRPPVEIP